MYLTDGTYTIMNNSGSAYSTTARERLFSTSEACVATVPAAYRMRSLRNMETSLLLLDG